MNNILEYKGFYGDSQISFEDGVVYGKLLYVNDLVTYEADSVEELKTAFYSAVDDYIEYCKEIDREPDKPFKGTFNVRISPSKHRAAAILADYQGISLNQLVEASITKYLEETDLNSREHQRILSSIDNLSGTVAALNNNYAALYFANAYSNFKEIVTNE